MSADLIAFTLALGLAAISPGPGIAALLSVVLGHGARSGVWFTMGVVLGDLVWLGGAMAGLAVLAQTMGTLFMALKWAGIIYLCYLAWRLWTAPAALSPKETMNDGQPAPSGHPINRIFAGWAVTIGNPKAMVFYLALLPSLVDLEQASVATYLLFSGAAIVTLSSVFGVYIVLAAKARQALQSVKTRTTMNRVSATAMVGAAAWIATK